MEKSKLKYLAIIGAFFTSLSSILIRTSNAPSLIISAYRMLFTVMMLLIPVLAKNRHDFKSISKTNMILCIFSGIFLALHFASWIASVQMTTIANSTILVSCSPIFVALANYIILKETSSSKMIVGICLSVAGTVIIALGTDKSSGSSMMTGNILAFLGAIFVAAYLVIGGIVRRKVNAGTYVFIVYSISTAVLFILCFLTHTPIYPYEPREFVIFAAMAFFCSILGHTVYNYLVKYVSSTLISVSSLSEPIFASILALIIFKEIPSAYTIFGGVIILTGIYYYLTSKTRTIN